MFGGILNPATEEDHMNSNIKFAAYGDYESGKTDLIHGLVKHVGAENVCVISAEGGLGTIESIASKIHVEKVGNLDEVRAVTVSLREGELSKYNREDAWVVYDGNTRILNWIGDSVMRLAEACYERKLDGLNTKPEHGRYRSCVSGADNFDSMRVYMFIGRDIESFVNTQIRLEANIYANFLMKLTKTVDRKQLKPWGPDCPGKMGIDTIMGAFDFVFPIGPRRVEGVRQTVCKTNPDPDEYLARKRLDRFTHDPLPDEIVGFDLGKFCAFLRGNNKEVAV